MKSAFKFGICRGLNLVVNVRSHKNRGYSIARYAIGRHTSRRSDRLHATRVRYGYIGTKDRMMYRLIMPGAIVQIDERRKRITPGPWHRELERPIYFLETRTGFACCWCAVENGNIILQPHPLSPESMRIMSLRQDVEIIGQVVAVAMRLHDFAAVAENPKR